MLGNLHNEYNKNIKKIQDFKSLDLKSCRINLTTTEFKKIINKHLDVLYIHKFNVNLFETLLLSDENEMILI